MTWLDVFSTAIRRLCLKKNMLKTFENNPVYYILRPADIYNPAWGASWNPTVKQYYLLSIYIVIKKLLLAVYL